LPKTTPDQQRRIRGTQDLIVSHNPEKALSTLPQLLTNQADRARLSRLLDRVMADEGMQQLNVTAEQLEMLHRIRQVLAASARPRVRSKTKLRLMRPALAQAA
jgi:nitrogen-specific signal transduction histidine kinase